MSASEKLKALEVALHFGTPTDRATFVAGRDAEHAILRALPQIVAVVEAAEAAADECVHKWLLNALTALEEALS